MIEFNGRLELKSLNEILRARGLQYGGRVQKYIDSEVIRYCDPLVPMMTGTLKHSATTETVIGTGIVKYGTPYGRNNYYNNRGNGTEGLNRGGHRGRLWFERMKTQHGADILRGAARSAGGRPIIP